MIRFLLWGVVYLSWMPLANTWGIRVEYSKGWGDDACAGTCLMWWPALGSGSARARLSRARRRTAGSSRASCRSTPLPSLTGAALRTATLPAFTDATYSFLSPCFSVSVSVSLSLSLSLLFLFSTRIYLPYTSERAKHA